jgi:hypothetical protein
MVDPRSQRELDALVELARSAEPEPLGALEARRMVRHAVAARRGRPWVRRPSTGLLCAALVLALLSGYALWKAPSGTSVAVGAGDRPLRLALKTGDALLLAPGSELSVLEQVALHRRVRLRRGSALFDVAKLGAGQGFEVETETARVRVLGTIFSVEVAEGRTLVRVYEGRVAVGQRVLAAPAVWASHGLPPARAGGVFAEEAQQLAAARAAQPAVWPAPAQPVIPVSPALAQPVTPLSQPVAPALVPPGAPASGTRPPATTASREPSHTGLPQASEVANASLTEIRALLAAGNAQAALELTLTRAETDDDFLLLAADALRVLQRHREAIAYYETLALRTHGDSRARAGFAAAQLAFHVLHDPAKALLLITSFDLAAGDCPLRERAAALSVDALLSLGRREQALAAARRYLEREPETETSRRMRALLRE